MFTSSPNRPIRLNSVLALSMIIPATVVLPGTGRCQSLFGDRGPLSQPGTGIPRSSGLGSQFGSNFGQPGGLDGNSPERGVLTGFPRGNIPPFSNGQVEGPGGFVGRGQSLGRFVGDQRATEQLSRGTFTRSVGPGLSSVPTSRQRRSNLMGPPRSESAAGPVQRRSRQIRPRRAVAFTYRQPNLNSIAAALSNRYVVLARRRPEFSAITVAAADEGGLTLRGQVGSEYAKALAETLARLEPGVHVVHNRLTVASQ